MRSPIARYSHIIQTATDSPIRMLVEEMTVDLALLCSLRSPLSNGIRDSP